MSNAKDKLETPKRRFLVVMQNGLGRRVEGVEVEIRSWAQAPPCLATVAVRAARRLADDVGPWKLVSWEEV